MFTPSFERAKREAREAPAESPDDEGEDACPHCGRTGELPMDVELELDSEDEGEGPAEEDIPDKAAFVRALRKETR